MKNNTWWMDPIYLGRYPEDGMEKYGADMPEISEEEMKIIGQDIDLCCLNIYGGERVRMGDEGAVEGVAAKDGCPMTAFKWDITPESMHLPVLWFFQRYGKPVVITENGMSNADWVMSDGAVHDPQRIDFTARYLARLKEAIDDGAKVLGYFHWSLLDNFEWKNGYSQRFGLIHVDYQTLKRTVKDSGRWYAEVIRSDGRLLFEEAMV